MVVELVVCVVDCVVYVVFDDCFEVLYVGECCCVGVMCCGGDCL